MNPIVGRQRVSRLVRVTLILCDVPQGGRFRNRLGYGFFKQRIAAEHIVSLIVWCFSLESVPAVQCAALFTHRQLPQRHILAFAGKRALINRFLLVASEVLL